MASKISIIIDAVNNSKQVLDDASKQVKGLGESSKYTKQEMGAAGVAIAGSLLAVGTVATQKFMDFEKTMSGVNAVLNPTQQEFADLSEKARELGRSTQYSATESASAIEMLAKNGLNATQILDGAADSSLFLAAATGADLASAADIATSAMLSFKLGTEDLNQAVNSIAGTTNLSKFGIEDYNLALAQGGGVAATVGVSFKDFNASVAAISPLFASGSDAGTSFKTMLLRLVPQSDGATSAMKELGIITKEGQNRFFDATGKMKSMAEISGILQESFSGLSDAQKNSAMNTIFGTDALRAASGLASTGADKFKELSTAIEGTNAADNAAKRMNNLSGAFEQLSGAVDDILISLGGALAPIIKAVAVAFTIVSNTISELIKMFDTLPEPLQNVISIFAGVAVAATIGIAGFVAFQAVLGGTAAAFAALTVAAAPWILLAAGIAAAAYAIYYAFENNLWGVRDIAMQVFDYLSLMWNRIVTEWGPIITAALSNISIAFQTAFNSIITIVQPILANIVGFVTAHWDQIMAITTTVFTMMKAYFDMTFGVIIGVFKAFLQVLGGDWQGAWETLKTTLTNAWEGMKTYLTGWWELTKGVFILALDGLKLLASAAWDSMKDTLTTAFTNIKTFFTETWDGISSFFTTLTEKIFQTLVTFVGLFDGDFDKFLSRMNFIWGDWWGKILTFGTEIFGKISAAALGAFNKLGTSLSTTWDGFTKFWSNAWNAISKFGTEAIASITAFFTGDGKVSMENGFTSMINGLGGIAKGVFNGILGTIEGFVNGAVGLINGLIDSANKLPGMSIPRVANVAFGRLAHGGVAGEGFFGGRAQQFASGGVVSGPRGIDNVPAMLTAGEVVLNAAQQGSLASRLQGGGQTVVIEVKDNNFYGDDESFAMKIGDTWADIMKRNASFPSFSQ